MSKDQNCMSKGCMERIITLESEVKKRVPWKVLTIILSLWVVIFAGSFLYTAVVKADLQKTMDERDGRQEKTIENVNLKMDAMLLYQSKMDIALAEHKAATEGRR